MTRLGLRSRLVTGSRLVWVCCVCLCLRPPLASLGVGARLACRTGARGQTCRLSRCRVRLGRGSLYPLRRERRAARRAVALRSGRRAVVGGVSTPWTVDRTGTLYGLSSRVITIFVRSLSEVFLLGSGSVRDFTFLVVFVALGGRRRRTCGATEPPEKRRPTRSASGRYASPGACRAVPVDFKNEIYR